MIGTMAPTMLASNVNENLATKSQLITEKSLGEANFLFSIRKHRQLLVDPNVVNFLRSDGSLQISFMDRIALGYR